MEPLLIKPTRKQQKHPLNLSLHVRRLSLTRQNYEIQYIN